MSWFRRNPVGRSRPKAVGRRLEVEALGDRLLPATGIMAMSPALLSGGPPQVAPGLSATQPTVLLPRPVTSVAPSASASGVPTPKSLFLLNYGDAIKAKLDQFINGTVIIQPIPMPDPPPPIG
jgi:hypothetical protein